MDRARRAARGRSGTAVTTGPTTVVVPEGSSLDTVRQNREREPDPDPPTISRAERLLAEPGESVGFGRERPPPSRLANVPGTPEDPRSRPTTGRPDAGTLLEAIAEVESLGSGGYRAIGPKDRRGDRPYGRYQIMGNNLPEWSRKYLGRQISPEEFLADREAQDQVARGRVAELLEEHDVADVASIWHSGVPLEKARGRRDVLGTRTPDYVRKVTTALDRRRQASEPQPERPGVDRTFREDVGELAKAAGRGVGSMVEMTGRAVEALPSMLAAPGAGVTSPKIALPAGPTRKAGQKVAEFGRETREAPVYEAAPDLAKAETPNPLHEPMWWLTRGAETVPQLATAVAGGAALGPAGFVLPIFAMEAGSAYEEAKGRGVSEPEAAQVGAIVGAGNALLESALGVGVGKVFGRLPIARKVFRTKLLERVPLRPLATGAEEAFEEAVQGAWNATIQFVASRDPEIAREFKESVATEAGVGGLVGTLFGLGRSGRTIARTAQEAPEEVRPEAPPATETPAPPIEPEEAPQGLLPPEEVAARLAQQKADAESLRPIQEKIELAREGKLAGRIARAQETGGEAEAVTPPIAPEVPPEAPESAAVTPIEPAQVEREAERPDVPRMEGSPAPVLDAENTEIPARYAVLALEDLAVSHDPFTFAPNPDFPQVSQGRNLQADKAAQAQLIQQSQDLRPELLLDRTTRATEGPPIVTPRGVALAGRGRLMMLHRAGRVSPERLEAYNAALAERAEEFGVDPTALRAVQNRGKTPVLVRVTDDITDLETMDELGRRFDVPSTKEIDALGDAAQRARLMVRKEGALAHFAGTIGDDQTARQYLEGPDGRRFLERLVEDGVIQQRELGNLLDVDRGTPTDKGKAFVENLLRAAAIEDPNVLRAAPAGVLQKIEHAVPPIVRAASVGEEWDIRPTLREAVEVAIAVKASSGHNSVAGFREQLDLTGRQFSEDALNLAQFIEENTATAVKKAFRAYAGDAGRATEGENLFGDVPTPEQSIALRFGEATDVADATGSTAYLDPTEAPPDPLLEPVIAPPEPGTAPAGAEPIGPRLTGRLLPPPGGPRRRRRLTSAPDVIHALTAVIEAAGGKTPIRTGRLGTRQARGVFKVEPEVIRLLEANNIPTAWHEAAHAIEKHIYGNPESSPWVNPRVGRTIQNELVALGRALYGGRKPAGGYKREGWAEFLRLWGTEAEDVKESAPATTSWFENVFLVENPDVKTALTAARTKTRTWRNQGALARAKASMVETGTIPDRLKAFYREVRKVLSYEGLTEMAQPLYKLAREAERLRGQELAPSEDPFFLTSALRTTHSARAKYMVERAMIDLAGNRVGPALNDIRPLVKGRGGDFTLYLWAKRAEALWLDKNRPEGRNPGLSLADARQIIAELQSDEFDLAAGMVWDWNDGVLDYAAQASPTFAEVVRRVREIDPGRYVPLQREFDALDEAWRGASRSATKASPVRKLRGSGRRVKNPIQAMVTNAEDTIRAAHQRAVVDAIMKLARAEGLGHLVEEVPRDRVPAAQRSVGELLDEISKRIGIPLDKATTAVLKEEGAGELEIADLMGEAVTFFSPVTQPKGQGEPIVAHYTPGEGVRWFHLDPDIYETLYAMDVYRLPKIADWTFGSMAAAFRAGTTTLRASFGLVWNPARDVQTMMVNTRAPGVGANLFFGFTKALGNAFLLRTTGINLDVYTDAFLALGGEMAQPLGQDIPHTRRAAKRVFEPKAKRLTNPRDWYDWYRDLVQAPESAPRVAELRAVAKDIGWEPGEPMTFDQSLELLLASKQVTTDFTAAGSAGRAVNRVVPFFNASIQGPRATGRAARRRPAVVLAKLLALTALTVWLWWENKDKEWYKNLDYREKFLHWHFEGRVGENEELVRIPRAFEIGLFASALPEAALDAWYHDDPDAVNEWWKTTWKSGSPGFLPPVAEVAAEQLANRQFYFDRPIVPMGEQRKPAEEQFNEYTSRTAIKLGELFNVSPRRIDHALEGTFGRVAGDLLEVVGLGPPELKREKTPADLPVIGRAFMRGGPGGTESKAVDRVYEALEAAQKRQASDKAEETPEQRTGRLQLTDATKAISALSYVRRFTPEREDRNALTREINAIANDALRFHREGRLERGRFSGARKVAERRKEQTK